MEGGKFPQILTGIPLEKGGIDYAGNPRKNFVGEGTLHFRLHRGFVLGFFEDEKSSFFLADALNISQKRKEGILCNYLLFLHLEHDSITIQPSHKTA